MHGDHADIDGRLLALVVQRLRLDQDITIDRAAPLRDLGVDSAALLSVVVGIEETFDVEIPDGDITIDNFGTLGAMGAYLAGRRAR